MRLIGISRRAATPCYVVLSAGTDGNRMNTAPPKTLRLFFALWPDDATRTALMQVQTAMHGRLVPYGNLHLTLAFLGAQPADVLLQAEDILARLMSPPMMLTLDRVGYFPRNRVAWAGMHHMPDELKSLHDELTEALRRQGIGFDQQQNFKPHVTLARDATLAPDISFDPIVWHADRVTLVQSVTEASGSTYQVIASRSLDEPCRLTEDDFERKGRLPPA